MRLSLMGLGSAAIMAASAAPAFTGSAAAATTPQLLVSVSTVSTAQSGDTARVTVTVHTASGTVKVVDLTVHATSSADGTLTVSPACGAAKAIADGCRLSSVTTARRTVHATVHVPGGQKSGKVTVSATATGQPAASAKTGGDSAAIAVDDPAASPSPTTSPTASPTTSPTTSPSPSPTGTGTTSPSPSPSPTASATTSPSPSASPATSAGDSTGHSSNPSPVKSSASATPTATKSASSSVPNLPAGTNNYTPPTVNGNGISLPQIAAPPVASAQSPVAASAPITGLAGNTTELKPGAQADQLSFDQIAGTQAAWLAALMVVFSLLFTQLRLRRVRVAPQPKHRRPRNGLFQK